MHVTHVPKLDSVRSYVLKAFGRSLSTIFCQPARGNRPKASCGSCLRGQNSSKFSNAARLVLLKFEYDQGLIQMYGKKGLNSKKIRAARNFGSGRLHWAVHVDPKPESHTAERNRNKVCPTARAMLHCGHAGQPKLAIVPPKNWQAD